MYMSYAHESIQKLTFELPFLKRGYPYRWQLPSEYNANRKIRNHINKFVNFGI